MIVVPHARAAGRWVVIVEYANLGFLAHPNLGDKRHEVAGYAVRVFANKSADMSADRVEVTKHVYRPRWIGTALQCQNLFAHQFGLSVQTILGVCKLPVYRYTFRFAIDCYAGRKNRRPRFDSGHGVQQADQASDIGLGTPQWLRYAFAHRFVAT